MSNVILTAKTALATPAVGDVLYIIDVSDTTDNAAGSSRKITVANLSGGGLLIGETSTSTLTNKTITSPSIGGTVSGSATYTSPTITSGVAATNFDLNGVELILDADADTSITADTDDQIDIKISGADDFRFTANQLNVLPGSTLLISGTLDANATVIDLDADNDTSISATSDDEIDLEIGGNAQEFTFGDGYLNMEDSDANILVAGANPWRTITLMPGFLKPTTTSGCSASTQVELATNDIDIDVLDFATGSDENAYANFHMPDSWDAGVIQFRYVWTSAGGTPDQTVTFELSGISFANSDALDTAVGTPVEVADTLITVNDVHISAWSDDVTLAGTPAAGELVHIELMRDVSQDNVGDDARLIALQIRYKVAQFSD